MNSRVTLITGCSTGIGRDLALRLGQSGYTVVASARRIDALDGIDAGLKLALDVTKPESIKEAIEKVVQTFGRIDVLVNNAGYAIRGAVEELSDDDVFKMFDVNVFGVIRMVRAVAGQMRLQRSGTIINIGSIAGKISMPVNGSYSGTKFAVEALSDAMRLELKPFGVKVVLIEPGNIKTNFVETARSNTGDLLQNRESPYSKLYRGYVELNDRLRNNEPGPEVVSQVVMRALGAANPKPRYKAAVPFSTRLMCWFNDKLRDLAYSRVLKIG